MPELAQGDDIVVSRYPTTPWEISEVMLIASKARAWEKNKKTQLSAEPVVIFVILPATGCAHTNVSTVPATHLSEQAKRN